jgi:hypothetical protein
MLLLAANRANCHEPYAPCEECGEGEDAIAEARRWCGERGEQRGHECEGKEGRNYTVFPKDV